MFKLAKRTKYKRPVKDIKQLTAIKIRVTSESLSFSLERYSSTSPLNMACNYCCCRNTNHHKDEMDDESEIDNDSNSSDGIAALESCASDGDMTPSNCNLVCNVTASREEIDIHSAEIC